MCALTDDKPAVVIDREPDQEKCPDDSAHASAAPNVVGRLARKTAGVAPAGICGTRSIREECVQRACTNGLQPSAPSVADGRRILIGTSNDQISTCSVRSRTNPQGLVSLVQSRT